MATGRVGIERCAWQNGVVSSGAPRRRDPIEPPPSRFACPTRRQAAPGDDLIAIGADLAPARCSPPIEPACSRCRSSRGGERSKIAWYSPDPRGIIPLDGLHVTRSMRRSCKRFEIRHRHRVRRGDAPRAAIRAVPGDGSPTEIVDAVRRAVRPRLGALDRGVADDRSSSAACTAWRIDRLFAGESMFHVDDRCVEGRADGAGRVAAANAAPSCSTCSGRRRTSRRSGRSTCAPADRTLDDARRPGGRADAASDVADGRPTSCTGVDPMTAKNRDQSGRSAHRPL